MPEVVAGLWWLRNPTTRLRRKSAWIWQQTEKPFEALRRPCHVRTEFSTHTEFARWILLLSACSATDRWLVKVIQSILLTETRATFGIGCGSCTVVLRLLSMKTISAYLMGLTLRLLTRDHDSMLINSDGRLLALTAGMMISVISKLHHLVTWRDWFQVSAVYGVDYVWWWSYTRTLDNAGCNCRHRR